MVAGPPSSIAPNRPEIKRPAAASTAPRLSPSWLAAQGRLPLAFMGLALAWMAAAAAISVAAPDLFAMTHAAPPVIALTHAWALGVFVTVATGAVYQLAPVALGTTLWSERTGWWHFWLHAIGVPGVVYGAWHWDLRVMGGSAIVVSAGIGVFAVNAWSTIYRSAKRDAVAWSLALATGWLTLTVLAGITLAANRLWAFSLADPLALLRAHAHLGLIGFFLTLLQGVTFRLIPMFTLGDVPNWRPVRIGLWLSQIGLLVLAPAFVWHAAYLAAGSIALIGAGIVSSGWALRQTLATRKKRVLDPGVRAFLRGTVVLAVAPVAGAALIWPTTSWGSAPGGFNAMIYAVIVFAGGLLPVIAGMMCKIVPFLTWMRAYGPKVGRAPTPPAGTLSRPALETWSLALQGIAVLPLLAGVWLLNLPLLRIGTITLAIGIAVFLANTLGVLRHLVRPHTGPFSKGSK